MSSDVISGWCNCCLKTVWHLGSLPLAVSSQFLMLTCTPLLCAVFRKRPMVEAAEHEDESEEEEGVEDEALPVQQQEMVSGRSFQSATPGEHSTHSSTHTCISEQRFGIVALLTCLALFMKPLSCLVLLQWIVLQRIAPGVAQYSLLSTPQMHAGRVACTLRLLCRRVSM